jgi:hypothetical protein
VTISVREVEPILEPPHGPRRWTLQSVVGALLVISLIVAIFSLEALHKTHHAATPPAAPQPAPTTTTPLQTPGFAFGFYSAGLKLVDCYGTCRPGTAEYAAQQFDRQRMAQLEAMHITWVTNNESIVKYYRKFPASVLKYLDELHAHHIRVSYSVASGEGVWFSHGKFSTSQAQTLFARTDLNHDGVSDLDGRLDALYQGHEVLEWATHTQRVQIYQVAKKWFPRTPVAVYYAGLYRPVDPAWADLPHPGGPGGHWRDYAYGPGETDIVVVNVRRSATPATIDSVDERSGTFNAAGFAAAARQTIEAIRQQTPNIPIIVSTNIASDPAMENNPKSMWSATELSQWYHALAAIPGVTGIQLRSFGRFKYDLGNAVYAQQQATYCQLAVQAARIPVGARP